MNQTHRKTTRLPHYDYTEAGAYFFTVLVKEWKCVLGKVVGEDVVLTKEGKIVHSVWNELPEHYQDIELDMFVVMPNHVHGIVWILESETAKVGARHALHSEADNHHVREGLRPSLTKHHGLPEIIRALKSFSARRINEYRDTPGTPFWHRSFYDHVIRDDDDLYNHRKYIQENPLKWALDDYYKKGNRG